MGAMDDVFGSRNLRPDHPDFWRLSEIVLRNDSQIQEAPDADAKDAAWENAVDAAGDRASIQYMFAQRALLAMKVPNSSDDLARLSQAATLAIDSFLVGVAYARMGGHRQPGTVSMTYADSTHGQSKERLSPARAKDLPMMTVGQMREVLAGLDDDILIVVSGDEPNSELHIAQWATPDEEEGIRAVTLATGESLDYRDF